MSECMLALVACLDRRAYSGIGDVSWCVSVRLYAVLGIGVSNTLDGWVYTGVSDVCLDGWQFAGFSNGMSRWVSVFWLW